MALIKCSECGREISDKAPACPGCGNPVEHGNNQPKGIEGAVINNPVGETNIKLGKINKLPQRIALQTFAIVFMFALIIYLAFSGSSKELATSFFWLLIIFVGFPATISEAIKMGGVSYIVNNDKITINSGRITKNSNSINYNLITDIFIQRKLFARLFGLSYIRFVTANAFSWSWLILNKDDAECLKNYILNNRSR